MKPYKDILYKGIPCKLYDEYMGPGDGPLVMVKYPEDIEKAYEMGFECIGHPTEVVKYISEEEYESWNALQAR